MRPGATGVASTSWRVRAPMRGMLASTTDTPRPNRRTSNRTCVVARRSAGSLPSPGMPTGRVIEYEAEASVPSALNGWTITTSV